MAGKTEKVWPLPKEGEPDSVSLPPAARPCPNLARNVFVCDKDSEEEMVEAMRAADRYAVDTEGTGLKIYTDKIIGFCFSVPPWTTGYYLPNFNGPDGDIWLRDRRVYERRLGHVRTFLEDDKIKVFFNALYDVPMIYTNHNIVVNNVGDDVMLKLHQLNPDSEHGLKPASVCYIDPNADWYEDEMQRYNLAVGGSSNKPKYWLIPPHIVGLYGGADAVLTGKLDDIVTPLVDPYAMAYYKNTQMTLLYALFGMRVDGVPLNRAYLQRGAQWGRARMQYLLEEMRRILGKPEFNPTFDQLNQVLYKELKLPGGRVTKKGFSTDDKELQRLQGKHPIIEFITEYRSEEKQVGSYWEPLEAELDTRDCFCPDPKINGTVVGRLSMNRLHQIPRGPVIRHAFVAGEDRIMVGGDYSQMDARVLAHLSRDPMLVDTFKHDRDIHAVTARDMFHLPCEVEQVEELYPEKRTKGKTINFALFTGEGVPALAEQLGVSKEEAQIIYDFFFGSMYRGIKPWQEQFIRYSRANKCVRNLFGCPRYIPGIEKSMDSLRRYPRYPMDRPSCYAKQARWGGLALSLRYDMGMSIHEWTPEQANKMRPLLQSYDRDKCAQCPHLWGCYYTVDYRTEQREHEEINRQLISTVIQGTTACLVNSGVARAYNMCRDNGYDARLHLFVHDEAAYSVPKDSNVDLFMADLKRAYESVADGLLAVPLKFEPKTGQTWADVKGYKTLSYGAKPWMVFSEASNGS